jgi:hypothetical protein
MKDIAWAAGFYEGEGSVSAPTAKDRTQRVQITQKTRWSLDKMVQLFGGKVYFYSYPATNTRPGREYFHYSLHGPAARGFLMTIFSFLSPRRREQITKALKERNITRAHPRKAV